MISKILIANRGEIAVRIIRTCKEMGIKTVAVYSTGDETSIHRKLADEDVCIGAAPSAYSYLSIAKIIMTAKMTGAEAIHPGYGFLSESATFAQSCRENGIVFIGPSPELIDIMGDKANGRRAMDEAGVPIMRGSKILKTEEDAILAAKEIGYPVILKASAGGGGRGMRICHNETELKRNYPITKTEIKAAFNSEDVYIEKYLTSAHHIEVQILADSHGNVIHVGERECSIQRNHQKLIEETPSPFVANKIRQEIRNAAIKGLAGKGYVGAGTLEFLVDSEMNYYFIEMNTRIQVEHTISEMLSNIDLIKQQILAASGEKLSYRQEDIALKGHAIECRINAEDCHHDFRPSPGRITAVYIPQGLGVRVDTHVYHGYEIPPHYDSMVAKLITWGEDRLDAIKKMKRSLSEFVIDGIETTIPFHLKMLDDPNFLKGQCDTKYLNQFKM